MLHLSLLTLPRSASRWRFIDSYQLHQVIWQGFPGLKKGEREKRFLYRHNETEETHTVLVQSVTKPDWSSIEDEADGTFTRVRDLKPERIIPGSQFTFLLRANPVVKRRGYTDDGSRNGARHIAVGSDRRRMAERLNVELATMPSREELLTQWLARKGPEGGFELLHCTPGPNLDVLVRRTREQSRDQRPITLTSVEFDGVLRVTDPARFADTLRYGIGRGKGFGLGLLSIARSR